MDLGMGSDEAWAEKGVKFEVVKLDMIDAVLEHLTKDFFPDEPIFRSLGLNLSNGTMMWEYKKSLEQGFSIAAVNTEGKILGVRIGVILKNDCGTWLMAKVLNMFNLMSCCLPQWMNVFQLLAARLEFNTFEQFGKLGCNSIYEDKALCSARWHGFRGLGTELVRRTETLARSNGCSHTYAIVSSKYSHLVFDRLDHTKLKSLVYADFVDSNGEPYLKDTREHTEARVYVKAL